MVAAEEISIAFPEIERERGLIEFWLELGSYRLSMRALVSLPSFAHTSIFIVYIYVYPPSLVSYRLKYNSDCLGQVLGRLISFGSRRVCRGISLSHTLSDSIRVRADLK